MYFNKPIRKALMIGCPGTGSNYLHGVSSDIENLNDYLCSERGGLWNPDEIDILWDPSFRQMEHAIKKQTANYTLTYYSGHGYTAADGKRMFTLKDFAVNDLFLLNDSPRQLCLADCCRDKELPTITGIPEEKFPFESLLTARDIFDQLILASDPGIKIIYGTGSGFPAYDESSRRGGVFTLSLLKAATSINKKVKHGPISLDEILELTASYLKELNSCQIPEIVYEKGNLQVPFALHVNQDPAIVKRSLTNTAAKRYFKPVQKKTNNWIIPGLILAAVVLSDNDD